MLKELLEDFVDSLEYVPNELKRSNIWLDTNRNKLLLKMNGNIEIVEHGKWREYTLKTFFLRPRTKLSECLETQIMENIKGFLLFKKLAQKALTAEDIIHCRNVEIRRILIERFGYEKFLLEMKGIVIHENGDYKLIKLDWHEKEEPIKLIRVKDSSTNRLYLLRVPPNMKTCKEAVAWTFGLNQEEYNPLKET